MMVLRVPGRIAAATSRLRISLARSPVMLNRCPLTITRTLVRPRAPLRTVMTCSACGRPVKTWVPEPPLSLATTGSQSVIDRRCRSPAVRLALPAFVQSSWRLLTRDPWRR
jgi:hypothetical protein